MICQVCLFSTMFTEARFQVIGQRNEISEGDVELVKKLYNCEERAAGSKTAPNPTVNPLILLTTSFTVEPSTTARTISGTSIASTASISQTTGKHLSSYFVNMYICKYAIALTHNVFFSSGAPSLPPGSSCWGNTKNSFGICLRVCGPGCAQNPRTCNSTLSHC